MNLSLPIWLEHFCLGTAAAEGQGRVWGIECAWYWPPWATLIFAIVAVAFVAVVYFHEAERCSRAYRIGLAAIRLSLVGLAVLMIAQISLSVCRTSLPPAVVLIDDSQSMGVVERGEGRGPHPSPLPKGEGTNRWELAREALTGNNAALLRGIAKVHDLRVFFLSGTRQSRNRDLPGIIDEIKSPELQPTGPQTRLGEGIRAVLDEFRGAAPVGIAILTDGVNTDGPTASEAAQYARRRGTPLFFVGFGSDRPAEDINLSDLLIDEVVFVNDAVNVECRLSATGFSGQKLPVVLREKGKPEVLAKVEVAVEADDLAQRVRMSFRPSMAGRFEYVVEVEPRLGELRTENNRLSKSVEVRREKIRVLLVQAYPSFEFRYLRNMLARDETISLKTVLQEADVEHAEQDSRALRAFPQRREELFEYDVVVLGDADPSLLSEGALRNLAEFVDQSKKGGALVMIAGPRFMPTAYRETPLAGLMPFAVDGVRPPPAGEVIRDGFLVEPTEIGLASPAMQLGDSTEETREIWRRLPPLYWFLELPALKPGVRVLAERAGGDGRRLPVFVLQYVGAGKVLFHATDDTWRWRGGTGDFYFARYWVQMIRYLCRSKLADDDRPVSLTTDCRECRQGEPVRLRARFADERLAPAADDGVTAAVERSGQQTQRVKLHRTTGRGVFEGEIGALPPGEYHAWIVEPAIAGPAAADFSIIPSAGEFARVRPDITEMRRAAEQSGGRFYTFENAQRLIDDFPAGRPVVIESLPSVPLWNSWPVPALFLGLLSVEWLLRKRCGMV